MYDCETITKLLHPHLDRELDVKESLRVQAHLQECSYCREIFLTEKEFLDLLRPHIAPEPHHDFLAPRLTPVLSRAARRHDRLRRALSPILFTLSGALAAMIILVLFKWVHVFPGNVVEHREASYLQRNIRWLQVASAETPLVSPWIADRLSCALDLPLGEVRHQTLLTPNPLGKERPQPVSH